MSRKNPFAGLDMSAIDSGIIPAKPSYGMTGAAKTVVRSIEEMAENTKRLMDGETIIEIDPDLLETSFIADRLSTIDEAYEELREAIKAHGQATPILIRPHPSSAGRYMVVFGHRRVQVAKDLGVPVRAVIKKLDDIAHAVAQGQENSARSNLSFIERAYFAQNLLNSDMSKDIVKAAIGCDDAMLSRLLSVIETIPLDILVTLGAAKKIGRDKWLSLRQLLLNPAYLQIANDYIKKEDFIELPEPERFDDLHEMLKRYKTRSVSRRRVKPAERAIWSSADNAVNVTVKEKPKSLTMEFTKSDGKMFAEWVSNNLENLYKSYQESET